MCTKNKRRLTKLFTGLLLMVAFSGLTFASEFSADVIMKGGPTPGEGKISVKGQKMRQELSQPVIQKIMILDLDKGIHCVLMPDSKMYIKTAIKTKGKGFRPENFMWLQHGKAELKSK